MSASLWTEHTTADGRKYWFHSTLLKSVWEKPEELKTPTEKLLDLLPWKEYKSPDGRKYWYNTQTKQSTWTCPPEVSELVEKMKKEVAGQMYAPRIQVPVTASYSAPQSAVSPMSEEIPDFQTKEEAEEAFINFLKESGVGSEWTWDRCMRSLVHYPMYKALKTVIERKEAFEKYVTQLRREEREREREMSEKRRANFLEMLKELKFDSFSRFQWAIKLCSSRPEWQAMLDDRERSKVFDDYVYDLRRAERENERQNRAKTREIMKKFIEEYGVTEETLWKDFFEKYISSEVYQQEEDLHQADLCDLLALFEEKMKFLESLTFEARRKEKDVRFREERKNRDEFKKMLQDLKAQGQLDVNSKWKDVFPLFKDDARFISLLGQMGSTPMDFYRDVIVDLEEEVYQDGKAVQGILKDCGYAITPESKYEEYLQVLADKECQVKPEHLKIIFEVLVDKAVSKLKEQKRREERKMKHLWDDFKYYVRKYDLKADSPLEKVHEAVSKLQCDEETVKTLWEKYCRRLKREEVGDSDTENRDEDGHHEKRLKTENGHHYYRKVSRSRSRLSPNHHDPDYEERRAKYRTRSPTPEKGEVIDYDG